jgi:hypothetical protein
VLLGVNGTQKSTLLRGMLDDALAGPTSQRPTRLPSAQTVFERPPRLVVALSAVPNDRFPSKNMSGGLSPFNRYSSRNYEYIGPRQGQNLVSRLQSVATLVSAVLRSPEPSSAVRSFIEAISEKTSVPLRFSFQLRHRPGHRPVGGASSARRFSATLHDKIPQSEVRQAMRLDIDDAQYAELDGLAEYCGRAKSPPFYIDLAGGSDFSRFSPQLIELALRFRFLAVGPLRFDSGSTLHSRQGIPDHFSAGEWGLFSSLTSLALLATDEMLLLVDEPESALHPSWQREYLDDLQSAIARRTACHIILATHSPLIVGAMRSSQTDLVILRKRQPRGSITADLATIPAGWQSNDILEDIFDLPSTRAPQLVARLDEALRLVAEGLAGNLARIRAIARELTPLTDTLPDDDSVRRVVISLTRMSGAS